MTASPWNAVTTLRVHRRQCPGERPTFYEAFALQFEILFSIRRFGVLGHSSGIRRGARCPKVEDAVRGAVRQTSGASYLALSPDLHRQLITAMKNVISNVAPHGLPPVILAPMDIRRFMRKLIERDFPDLAVLSYQELDPGANVQPLERIKFVTQLSAA